MIISVGGVPAYVELADNDYLRTKGLMHRESLLPDSGMLFMWPDSAYRSFWMKNTLVPLSIAYITNQGKILNIEDMKPHSLKSVASSDTAMCALEMPQGWFSDNGIVAGDVVTGLFESSLTLAEATDFDLSSPDFYYKETADEVIDFILSNIDLTKGVQEDKFTSEFLWHFPISPEVWAEYWDDYGGAFFDVSVSVTPTTFSEDHPGWNIDANAGFGSSSEALVSVDIQLDPSLPVNSDILRRELYNAIPHEIHHLTQSGQPFERPNCPATPPAEGDSYFHYFTQACEIPSFLIGFRGEAAASGEKLEDLVGSYLQNYVGVGAINNEEAEKIKSKWLGHSKWLHEGTVILEGSMTGNRLEGVATHVADKAVEWLQDEDIRKGFAEQGKIQFQLDVELPDTVLWLRDVFVRLFPADDFNSTAAYEFTLDADDAQRQESDMVLNLYMPQDYTDDELERLHVEIESDARHELEHSGQLTSVLMDVQEKMPDGEIWKSLQAAEDYYTSEAEVPAHVAALVMKSKRRDSHGADEVDRELNNIYHTGLSNGYSEEELSPLMTRMREVWQYYIMSRWPEQDWPIEFRPEPE